jgi:hypothetical protein
MLSRIDDIIYPNRCEVIEIEPSQRYIYPIYKNGRSSILRYSHINNCKTLINEQISRLNNINIILRNPLDRFISGVNTFVWNTLKDHPNLDTKTILYFAENYLFLNRHYAPQLTWLINLSKYCHEDAKLILNGFDFITSTIGFNEKPESEGKMLSIDDINRLKTNIHNEMYLRLDTLLLDLVGQELTFKQILKYLKDQDPIACSKLQCTVLD